MVACFWEDFGLTKTSETSELPTTVCHRSCLQQIVLSLLSSCVCRQYIYHRLEEEFFSVKRYKTKNLSTL